MILFSFLILLNTFFLFLCHKVVGRIETFVSRPMRRSALVVTLLLILLERSWKENPENSGDVETKKLEQGVEELTLIIWHAPFFAFNARFAFRSVCVSVCLSLCQFVSLSLHRSVSLCLRLSVTLSFVCVCVSSCMFVSGSLSVCLCLLFVLTEVPSSIEFQLRQLLPPVSVFLRLIRKACWSTGWTCRQTTETASSGASAWLIRARGTAPIQ